MKKRDPKITHTRGDCIVVEKRQRAHQEYAKMGFAERIRLVNTVEMETGKTGLLALLDYLASKMGK